MSDRYHLKVLQVETTCLFELSRPSGYPLTARLAYPDTLEQCYQQWQEAYRQFYGSALRGQVIRQGAFPQPQPDWRTHLVQTEAEWLHAFHHWLEASALQDICTQLSQAAAIATPECPLALFLSCEATLAHLPWETWPLAPSAATAVHVYRSPLTLRASPTTHPRPTRPRLLAILGDSTGLSLHPDQAALQTLAPLLEIVTLVRPPEGDHFQWHQQIAQTLTDPAGWDLLLFAGHSQTRPLTGGEFNLAPGESLLAQELLPELKVAQQQGLKIAIFNSCSGLGFANLLIDEVGLSQVVVFREPVQDAVAQRFWATLAQSLRQCQTLSESFQRACQDLHHQQRQYPSSWLIPSLFHHPDAPEFALEPHGWSAYWRQRQPTTVECLGFGLLLVASLSLPFQGWLTHQRLLVQALYRHLTHQGITAEPPPILLVQIDTDSIRRDRIQPVRPMMDRRYLARLVNRLTALGAPVLGLDYVLDRPQERGDHPLAQALQRAVTTHHTWIVTAATLDQPDTPHSWLRVLPDIASPRWSLEGDIDLILDPVPYLRLPGDRPTTVPIPPFAQQLAIADRLRRRTEVPVKPHRQSLQSLQTQVQGVQEMLFPTDASRQTPSALTQSSYSFGQAWFHPIIDFSIPPAQVYQTLPAWQLLSLPNQAPQLKQVPQQVVIIAPGGYQDAGVNPNDQDTSPTPLAVQYGQRLQAEATPTWTGAEVHAYMLYLLLQRRQVIPLPDCFGVLLIWGGHILLPRSRGYNAPLGGFRVGLKAGLLSLFYGLIGLQVFVSTQILMPWLLPTLTLGLTLLSRRYPAQMRSWKRWLRLS